MGLVLAGSVFFSLLTVFRTEAKSFRFGGGLGFDLGLGRRACGFGLGFGFSFEFGFNFGLGFGFSILTGFGNGTASGSGFGSGTETCGGGGGGSLTAGFGSGAGFGLGVAVAIATGGTFLEWKAPEKRRVIFVDGEMAQQDLQHWVLLELQALGTKAEDADLFLLSTGMQKEGMPNLATEEGQSKLGEILVAGDVLILDNESCLFWETPGDARDENSGRSIEPLNSWFLRLRHRGVTVILIHHAGKNGS